MLLNARRFPPEGPFELLLLAIEDITDRKQAEEKDRRSEALLVEAQRLARIGSWNWDLTSGDLSLVGRALPHLRVRAAGSAHHAGPGLGPGPPGRPGRVRDLFDRAIRDRQPYDCIFRLILDDGAVRTVQSRGRPAVNEGGKVVRMFGTIQDVTERMQTEQALRESEERFQVALAPPRASWSSARTGACVTPGPTTRSSGLPSKTCSGRRTPSSLIKRTPHESPLSSGECCIAASGRVRRSWSPARRRGPMT